MTHLEPSSRGNLPEQDNDRNVLLFGVLTVYTIVFLALIGQGCPPREAAAITVGLAIGTAEAMRRLLDRDDDAGSMQ